MTVKLKLHLDSRAMHFFVQQFFGLIRERSSQQLTFINCKTHQLASAGYWCVGGWMAVSRRARAMLCNLVVVVVVVALLLLLL